MVVICLLTGHFRSILIFTSLILIHELGHFLCAYFLGWDCLKIEIFPYGGCSFFDSKINIPLWQEFLVLIMGPILQIIFIFILSFIVSDKLFFLYLEYSNWILIFNFLPIYPLDGGKLLFLFTSKFFSYYYSCSFIFGFSFFLSFFFLWIGLFITHNFIFFLVFIFLILKVLSEIEKINYYIQKFLMERYLFDFSFLKSKIIKNIKKMRRTKYHFFLEREKLYPEQEFLIKKIYKTKE